MYDTLEEFITNFLRTYTEPFTAKELSNFLKTLRCNISIEEIIFFLTNDRRVFALQKGLFITRAGAFINQFFSFTLTQMEIENKLFVPGDRFMPFVDNDMPSSTLIFEFLGQKLPKKIFEIDSTNACELFTLYGDEYVSQYITADPACSDINLAETNFELPPKLSLTAVSLESVFARTNFRAGDRFLARVKDWNKGIVEIFPELSMKSNPFQVTNEDMDRQKWEELLEKKLIESFERMGPCSSMEEQLANVFYENRAELCVPGCSSISECLRKSKKISQEFFGVETRLWKTGEEIPAVGAWNGNTFGLGLDGTLSFYTLPDYIIDSLLKDQMYEKKNDIEEIINKLKTWRTADCHETEEEIMKIQLMGRNELLRRSYNWFADFFNGSIRHDALDLYSRIRNLLLELDCDDGEFCKLPQQELITLSQLFTHISRILEILSGDEECNAQETDAMKLSLEGMVSNFEDIKPLLISAVNRIKKNRFNVI